MEVIRGKLAEAKVRLADVLQQWHAASHKEEPLLSREKSGFEDARAKLAGSLATQLRSLQIDAVSQVKKQTGRRASQAARIEKAYAKLKGEIETQQRTRSAEWEQQKKASRAVLFKQIEEKSAALKKKHESELYRLEALKTAVGTVRKGIADLAATYGVTVKTAEQKPAALPQLPADAAEAVAGLSEQAAGAESQLAKLQESLRKRWPAPLVYGGVIAVHAAGAYWVYTQFPASPYPLIVGGVLFVALGIVYSIYHSAWERTYQDAVSQLANLDTVSALIKRQTELTHQKIERTLREADDERVGLVCSVDEKVDRGATDASKTTGAALEKLRARRDKAAAKVTLAKGLESGFFEREAEQASEILRKNQNKTLEELTLKHAARCKEIQAATLLEYEQAALAWDRIIADFAAFSHQMKQRADEQNPVWRELCTPDMQLPTQFPTDVHVGEVTVALKNLVQPALPARLASTLLPISASMPLGLSFPAKGGLVIRCGQANRETAMRTLSTALLRLLASFPAGKAKLTIIDPIGLGQNFASFMHLSDYDESIVGGKIWSEAVHIERKLSELTEHMEKIIQKYLRNRYSSIDEFNREAGQLAEPYRFVVIADFPTDFSELALERLASIVTSGARCGVYTLMLHDERHKLSPLISEPQLRRNGLFIVEEDGRLTATDQSRPVGLFTPEEAPSSAGAGVLIHAIGKQCQEATRVQVPFDAAAPKPREYWSSSAEQGVRLPLGKAGADRLQYLHLGRGTAQHALIAGKTGSGKSNLFHTIITNAALWHSPRELEFYLIDFKKGVEFKTYGTNRLPHARVIAIESDREFGLSVLRRIDRELSHRGELFRRAQVQDFPSFRKAAAGKYLPRTLLIIDEFQEFFVDDDSVAQDAALLLDRIVRQGRAFGIHVILGSQTLGGTYSLAKSTLGQMAVRIALQCNEADSYLILNDDNAAAALLSRPGEAIYNDMSGQIEGNNPFQAVFLPKEIQDSYLRIVQQKAEREAAVPDEPTAVFEGNILADIRNNRVLSKVAAHIAPQTNLPPRIWMGEPNAIKGPAEVEFTRQAGSNLLVVGQRGDAEVALCCAALLSLAAAHSPDELRVYIFDGAATDMDARERLKTLIELLPHSIEIVEHRRIPEVLEELATERTAAETGTWEAEVVIPVLSGGPITRVRRIQVFVMVLGLERFRILREDDEFRTSSDDNGNATPAANFVKVLTEGPGEGIHTIAWCDTFGNLGRTLSRKTLREFEMRVLFQMSANDSSELIDSPAANRLGLYNALLFTAKNGTLEKFRPYALPDTDIIEDLTRAIQTSRAHPQAAE